jgi:predicted transcriptional regulator
MIIKKVKDYMSSPVNVIERNEPIQMARNLMFKYSIGRLPVLDNGKLVGIVTKYDITNRLNQAAPEWRRRPIDKVPIQVVMTEKPITIFPDATMPQAAELLIENDISGLPVERDGEIVGMITTRDMVKYFSEQDIKATVGDLMSKNILNVHRHHTIGHVLEEMNVQGVSRALVYEDNTTPVGIVTRSGLTFSEMMGPKDEMETKNIKMTRKESAAGRKQYRYVKQMPFVAEDVMTSPIFSLSPEIKAVEASKTLEEKHIIGMPVLRTTKLWDTSPPMRSLSRSGGGSNAS